MSNMDTEIEGIEVRATISKQGFITNLKEDITPADGIIIVKFEFFADSALAAYAEICVYDNESCAEDVYIAADDMDADQSCAVGALTESFTDQVDLLCDNGMCVAYIRHVYVYPSWRGYGIGTWIFKNLACLIYEYSWLTVGAFCVIPKPMVPTKHYRWEYDNDPDNVKRRNMIHILEKNGYVTHDDKTFVFLYDIDSQ